jgi:hypothetical protein
MEPIRRLRLWKQDKDLGTVFQELSEAVKHAASGARVNGEKGRLEMAAKFFDAFYERLEAEQNALHPPLGNPVRGR